MKKRPKSPHRFTSFYFDRYLFNAMRQKIAPNYFRLLSEEDRTALVDPDTFIAQASLEEKLMLLQRLGHVFAISMLAPQKAPRKDQLVKMVDQFFMAASWRRTRATKVFRDRLVFVLCDAEFMKGLKLAANLLNSPAAASYAGYGAIANRLYEYKYESSKKMMRDITAAREIDSVITAAINLAQIASTRDGFKNLYGIDERQFVLLSLLSKHKELTVTEMVDISGFRGNIVALEKMMVMKYVDRKWVRIQSVGDTTRLYYWITGLGEQALIKARNYFLQNL